MTTSGVSLRPLTVEDTATVLDLHTRHREFLRAFDPVRPDDFFTEAGQRVRVTRLVEQAVTGSAFGYLIHLQGTPVGRLTLSNVVGWPLLSASVGYWVVPDANGGGVATTALAEAVALAFGPLALHRLEAGTLLDNYASQRVLEKNGFERIGVARRYLAIAGEWRDHLLFQRTSD